MKESKIFTKAELKEIDRREKGDKADKNGLFSNRIKPKILEIDYWRNNWSKLKKLIDTNQNKNRDKTNIRNQKNH